MCGLGSSYKDKEGKESREVDKMTKYIRFAWLPQR